MQEQYNNIILSYIIYWHAKHSFLAATGSAHSDSPAGTRRHPQYNYLQYRTHRTWFSNTFIIIIIIMGNENTIIFLRFQWTFFDLQCKCVCVYVFTHTHTLGEGINRGCTFCLFVISGVGNLYVHTQTTYMYS